MDKVTQHVAANAEKSANSSEEMRRQAEQMEEIINDLVVMVDGSGEKAGGRQVAGNDKEVETFDMVGAHTGG